MGILDLTVVDQPCVRARVHHDVAAVQVAVHDGTPWARVVGRLLRRQKQLTARVGLALGRLRALGRLLQHHLQLLKRRVR